MTEYVYADQQRLIEFSARPGDTSVMVADKIDHAVNFYPAEQPIQTQADLDDFAHAWLAQVEPRVL